MLSRRRGGVLRGHRAAGEPGGRLPAVDRRRDRVPGRHAPGQGSSDEPISTRHPAGSPTPPGRTAAGHATLGPASRRRVGQVPHRPRLADRPGASPACCACVFTFVVANGNHQSFCTGAGVCTAGHPFVPTGPGGEAVADSYQYYAQSLTGDGNLTARISSLTGLIYNGPTQPGTHARRHPAGLGRLDQGRHPAHAQHQAGIGLRRGHGDRRPRHPLPIRLHPRPARPARNDLEQLAAVAAADPYRRHDHRLRLRPTAPAGSRSAPPACPACRPPSTSGCSPPRPSRTRTAPEASPLRPPRRFDHITLTGRRVRCVDRPQRRDEPAGLLPDARSGQRAARRHQRHDHRLRGHRPRHADNRRRQHRLGHAAVRNRRRADRG